MLIKKFIKKESGIYKLLLDNNQVILLHEDLILKYDLLLNRNINDDLLKSLLEDNKFYLVYLKALKYLSKKLRTIKEVKEYLLLNDIKLEIVLRVIDLLIDRKYLDDDKYTKAFIHDKISFTRDGPFKIYYQLYNLGIDKNLIISNLVVFNQDLISLKISEYITKEIKFNRTKSSTMLKFMMINNLINFGYKKEDILKELNNYDFEDNEEIFKKEYLKLLNKYKKKYQGKLLENKIRNKMEVKGFKTR